MTLDSSKGHIQKYSWMGLQQMNWGRQGIQFDSRHYTVHKLWSQTPSYLGLTHCLSHWLTPFQPHWTTCCSCTRQDILHPALLHSLSSVPGNALPSRWLILSTSSLWLQNSLDQWAVCKPLYSEFKPKFHSPTTQHTPILFTSLFFSPWHLPSPSNT